MLQTLKGWMIVSYLIFLVIAMTYGTTNPNKEDNLIAMWFAQLFLIITLIVMMVTK